MRKDLKPRVISVERDGFGLTAPTEGYTYQDHASEVMRVLDHPDIEKAAFVAISGGTPYLAQTAAAIPDRVTSVHMLAVFSQYDPENTGTSGLCGLAEEKITGAAAYHAANPEAWWTLGENGPMRKIPGFTHASRNDGARAFPCAARRWMDGAALMAEFKRFCTSKAADLSAVTAPAFIYYGTADTAVRPVHAAFWKNAFPNIHKIRVHEGEGHDIQYRHWDQVPTDLGGMGDKTVMCIAGQPALVDEADAARAGRDGGSTGIRAWQ